MEREEMLRKQDNKVNLAVYDQKGRTALFYARLYVEKEMEAYLIKNGAAVDWKDDSGISIQDLERGEIRLKVNRECGGGRVEFF